MPPRKSKKTRVQSQKKKNGKRTRRNSKAKKVVQPDTNSYLATLNNNDFVMVDKSESITPAANPDDRNKIVVGKIYANWCGHCQDMSAAWSSLAGKLDTKVYIVLETEESELPSRLDEINAFYLPNSTEKLTANGYPTIYRIEKNAIKYYDGDRTTDAMYDWFVTQRGGEKEVHVATPAPVKEDAPAPAPVPPPEKKGWFGWW